MEKSFAERLVEEGAKNYDIIASDYARTRKYNSQDLVSLASLAKQGEKVLDLGCANGRMIELFSQRGAEYYGIDASEKLIEIAKKTYQKGRFQTGSALNLPFEDNAFDKVYFISVLHHIPSGEFRQRCFSEIRRVLKPDGLMILRVWDLLRIGKGRKLFLKYAFLKLSGKTKIDFFDLMMPWKDFQQEEKAERYFHAFRIKELKKLAKSAGFETEKIWREGKGRLANIYLIARKKINSAK
ncbi:MAG: methyltransferase domain-containing protein [Candidatus Paceibacterota bacterium]|jgi:ubiquinone/menaquinone biosynthesis C-methylase UbiE